MKKVETWIADDGEEFSTEEACYAYEHRLDGVKDSVIFLDDEFRPIGFNLANIYDEFLYIVILDAEKAEVVFRELKNYGSCFVKPRGYADGDILMWDCDNDSYIDLVKEIGRIEKIAESVRKGANLLG